MCSRSYPAASEPLSLVAFWHVSRGMWLRGDLWRACSACPDVMTLLSGLWSFALTHLICERLKNEEEEDCTQKAFRYLGGRICIVFWAKFSRLWVAAFCLPLRLPAVWNYYQRTDGKWPLGKYILLTHAGQLPPSLKVTKPSKQMSSALPRCWINTLIKSWVDAVWIVCDMWHIFTCSDTTESCFNTAAVL